jgi:hypothetical protein
MVLLDRFSLLALHFSPERTSQYFSTIAGFEIGKSSSLDAKQTLPDSSATRHAIGAKTTPRKAKRLVITSRIPEELSSDGEPPSVEGQSTLPDS